MVLVLPQNGWPWTDVSDKGAFVKTVFATQRHLFHKAVLLYSLTWQDNTVTFTNTSHRIFIAIVTANNVL